MINPRKNYHLIMIKSQIKEKIGKMRQKYIRNKT